MRSRPTIVRSVGHAPSVAPDSSLWSTVQRTKKQHTSAGKRLGLLYAVHEVFRGAAKDPDMDLDYGAWKDALRALVPWAWRKQKEEDQAKIRKAVSLCCTCLGHDLGL